MKMIPAIFVCFLLFQSCHRSPVRMEQFRYGNGQVEFAVPKGYNKKWTSVDDAGNTILTYTWRNGAVFYIAHMADTSDAMQPIDHGENIPRISHHNGSLIYKGIDEQLLFWREVRQRNFKMGYRFVDDRQEYKFDSATNYAVVWPLQ